MLSLTFSVFGKNNETTGQFVVFCRIRDDHLTKLIKNSLPNYLQEQKEREKNSPENTRPQRSVNTCIFTQTIMQLNKVMKILSTCHIKLTSTSTLADFEGCRHARPQAQSILIFMRLSKKNWPNNRWVIPPPLREILDPPLIYKVSHVHTLAATAILGLKKCRCHVKTSIWCHNTHL